MAPSDPVDRDIKDALTAGDPRRALRLTMRHHGDAVYHYCRRMVGDEQAPDIQQLIFIDVYRGFPAFDRRSTVRTWVFSIARHRCIDALRSRQRRRGHEEVGTSDLDDTPDPQPDPRSLLEHQDREAALRDCIDRLAPASRSAVLLRYQEGLAYADMAAMSGEQAGTIGRRVARALVVLRTCIERALGAQP